MRGAEILIPLVGMIIPILAISVGALIAITALKHNTAKREQEHRERMLAIEKGVGLPQPVIPPVKRKNPYLWGFIFVGLGVAMGISLIIQGDDDWVWGMVFFCVGLAILLAHNMHDRQIRRDTEGVRNGLNHPPNGSDIS